MMILKACPKCHGALSVENDMFSKTLFNRETDFACLQCGKRLAGAERSQMLGRIMRWQSRQTTTAAA